MPRIARVKSFDGIFHIMCRSISEVELYKDDDDRVKYLSLIKKYQKIYEFRVYGYCLMSNHAHLIIDANGSDISRVMHSINFSYAQYFNKKHERHGHLFQDRFKSKMIKDERYLFALSSYVHNNPVDIQGYVECPEKYDFSSLSIFLGIRRDPYELVDDGFIMKFFGNNAKTARENYLKLVMNCNYKKLKDEIEFVDDGTEYKSYRKVLVRDVDPQKVIKYIAEEMKIKEIKFHIKNTRNVVEAKAIAVLLMRSFCNIKCSSICNVLGNITQVRVSKLSSIGMKLIDEDEKYYDMVRRFIKVYAA